MQSRISQGQPLVLGTLLASASATEAGVQLTSLTTLVALLLVMLESGGRKCWR